MMGLAYSYLDLKNLKRQMTNSSQARLVQYHFSPFIQASDPITHDLWKPLPHYMRYPVLLLIMFFLPSITVVQAGEYLWLQNMGDEIIVISTNRSLDRRVPTNIKNTIKMEVIRANQQLSVHVLLDLVREYEAQGWEVRDVDSGIWIFRREE